MEVSTAHFVRALSKPNDSFQFLVVGTDAVQATRTASGEVEPRRNAERGSHLCSVNTEHRTEIPKKLAENSKSIKKDE